MLKFEFWELRRGIFCNSGFSARQFHVLLQLKSLQLRMQNSSNGRGGGIMQLSADRKLSSLVIRPKLRGDKRVSERNFSALRQKYFPPDAHHFVRRSGIPIHPSDLQVVLLRREDFHRDRIS